MAYARWNCKNSEWGLTYGFGYSNFKHANYSEKADYLLSLSQVREASNVDGIHYYISRQDSARRDRSFSNNIQLKYNLADSASYVFQATLTGDFSHSPGDRNYRRFVETGNGDTMTMRRNRDKSFSPVLDMYFYHTLGSHQSITANVVGTSIATDQYQNDSEGKDYAYNVDGKTWSLTSEAVYENQLKPFTMSLGVNHLWKYTRNIYTGDAESMNNMHNSNLYHILRGRVGERLPSTIGYSAQNSHCATK